MAPLRIGPRASSEQQLPHPTLYQPEPTRPVAQEIRAYVGTFRVWLAVNTCASLRVTFRLSLPVGSFGRRQPCSPVRQRSARAYSRHPGNKPRSAASGLPDLMPRLTAEHCQWQTLFQTVRHHARMTYTIEAPAASAPAWQPCYTAPDGIVERWRCARRSPDDRGGTILRGPA